MEQIIVGFDGSADAQRAVEWATEEGARRGLGVVVVQSWKEPVFASQSWTEAWEDPKGLESAARATFVAAIEDLSSRHAGVEVSTSLVDEPPARALVAASAEAAMVVVGARGRGGFASLLLGSVSQRVASTAATTVVVVRGAARPDGEVVVGIDGSELSRKALAWASEAARLRSVPLRVVQAWSFLTPAGVHGPENFRSDYTQEDASQVANQVVEEVLGADHGLDVEVEAPCDLPAKALVERAATAGLLVVGSRGVSPLERLTLGSVSVQLLHHADCPVAIVR